jgi:drug/metabolite transporter (DMT)-like permease
MMSPETLAIAYGLSSALTWGAGDFSGGFATKRGNVFAVIFFSQVTGAGLLLAWQFFFGRGWPSPDQVIWGSAAGVCGAIGLVALYRGLASGRMGIVAPLSAIMTALVPIMCAFFSEGLPKTAQLAGLGVALAAVWFLSAADTGLQRNSGQLTLPLMAGVGFGLFFVCIDRASTSGILWPLIMARLASLGIFTSILFTRRQMALPEKNQLACMVLAGIMDTAGNAFFALACQVGRLDVSAVLASMYPASTVLLAWVLLKERLHPRQWIGVGTALCALALIAA